MRRTLSRISTFLTAVFLLWAIFHHAAPVSASASPDPSASLQPPINNRNEFRNELEPLNLGFPDEETGENQPQQEKDTVRKERKPLESYFFDDSVRQREIFAWNVNTYRNVVRMITVDTAISSRQPFYPFIRKGVGDAYQGNMGGASIPLSYADRAHYRDFSFAQAFDAYYIFPETARFFNVKKPFTHFSYYSSGQTRRYEEGFYISHAQNISPSTGFNVDYKSVGTRGYYEWSKGRDKNLSLAFSHTGRNYTVHAGYIYNTVNNKENGGIVNDRHVTDTIYELPENVPVKLTDARNVIKGNTFYLVQSYGTSLRKASADELSIAGRSSLFVGHSLTYGRWSKVYTDTRDKSRYSDPNSGVSTLSDFYDNWYINPSATYDSINETLLSNRLFVQLQPFDRDGIVGLIDAGIGMDNHRYYMFRPDDFISGRRKGVSQTEYYVYGAIGGKFRRYFDWNADIEFHPAGENSGDLSIGADASLSAFIRGRAITLSGKFRNELRSPDFWSKQFYSNHFAWSNSFKKENETRFDVSLSMPSVAFEAGASQSVITDKVYYGAQALPVQNSGAVSVTGLYADKDFRFGGFHLRHRVLLQWSTKQEVIPVPLASAYLSYYFEFNVVKNVLRAQIGIDGRYNTPYYAFGYMPATAQFYNQREKEIGGYPMLDFYVAAKWKRMRILLKMEHVNENLFGSRNYFTLLHYPMHKRVFKLGMSWAFYD